MLGEFYSIYAVFQDLIRKRSIVIKKIMLKNLVIIG